MKDKMETENKIVFFPGMLERMLESAVKATENQQFDEAIDQFEKYFMYAEADEYSLSVFVHCLYEAKDFIRAKEICEDLIELEPENYIEVMELYLTICMQLKQFIQVEKIINSMIEKNLISEYEMDKFLKIQNLNKEMAENSLFIEEALNENPQYLDEELNLNHFLMKTDNEKIISIQQMSNLNIRPYAEQLISIVETKDLHPFVKSLILIMLVEQQIAGEVNLYKWGIEEKIALENLPFPTSLPQYKEIETELYKHFEHDPSIVELASHLLIKHAIVAYPFEWRQFKLLDVVKSYKSYIEEMFGYSQIYENEELYEFIVSLEKYSDLQ